MKEKPWMITIMSIPKSHNSLLMRHWRVKYREKLRWVELVGAYMPRGPWWVREGQDPERVRLVIVVYRKALQDPDNAVASCKYLIDAMNRLGWMVDDSSDWLDLEISERIDRKHTRTEIHWTTTA